MKKRTILWRNSIFTRLVVTFLLVMVPLYALGILIFQWSKNMMSSQIFGTMQGQVSVYLDDLSNNVKRIKDLQSDCMNDDDLNTLVYAPMSLSHVDWTKAVTHIQQNLLYIRGSSIYIYSACIGIPSIGIHINSIVSSGTDKTISNGEFGSVEDLDDNLWTQEMQILFTDDSPIAYLNGQPYLFFAPEYYVAHKETPPYIMDVELSEDEIANSLSLADGQTGIKSLLIDPSNGVILASDNDAKTSEELRQNVSKYYAKNKTGAVFTQIDGKTYLLTYAYSDYLGLLLARYLPGNTVFAPLDTYQVWYWSFTLLAVVIIILYSLYTYKVIKNPLNEMVTAFKKVKAGDFGAPLLHKSRSQEDEFRYMFLRFNDMVLELKESIDQAFKQKILAQKSELKQLQSQINPHFLYNSFFILNIMARNGDDGGIEEFTAQLGEYFRFITRNDAEEVSLAKEVAHARTYACIQAKRFANRVKVDFGELPPEYAGILVPRLILQPIIENAFEHGVENIMENGVVSVAFRSVESGLEIVVKDSGGTMDDEKLRKMRADLDSSNDVEVTGIINIHKRLQYKFGRESGLFFDKGDLGGLRVTIRILFQEGLTQC